MADDAVKSSILTQTVERGFDVEPNRAGRPFLQRLPQVPKRDVLFTQASV